MSMVSNVKAATKAAFWSVADLVGSTPFRHRMVVLTVPVAVEVITQAQAAFTGASPDANVRVVVDTVALFVANWLRGKADPA